MHHSRSYHTDREQSHRRRKVTFSFWGFFIVRYDDEALWAARIQQSVANHATTPDYTRALIFQLSLMVHMSHESTNRLTDMLVAVAPVLRANPKLGGWQGEGALYTMILQISALSARVLSFLNDFSQKMASWAVFRVNGASACV